MSIHTSAKALAEEREATLLRAVSSTTARILGKPESYVMTCLMSRSRMTFAGSSDPSCLVEVKSIGGIGGDRAKQLTEAMCKLVQDALAVPSNRVYVVFADVPASLWGFDRNTFG